MVSFKAGLLGKQFFEWDKVDNIPESVRFQDLLRDSIGRENGEKYGILFLAENRKSRIRKSVGAPYCIRERSVFVRTRHA